MVSPCAACGELAVRVALSAAAPEPVLSTVTEKLPDFASPFSSHETLKTMGCPTRAAGTVTVCWKVIDCAGSITVLCVPWKSVLPSLRMTMLSIAYCPSL